MELRAVPEDKNPARGLNTSDNYVVGHDYVCSGFKLGSPLWGWVLGGKGTLRRSVIVFFGEFHPHVYHIQKRLYSSRVENINKPKKKKMKKEKLVWLKHRAEGKFLFFQISFPKPKNKDIKK